MLNFISGEEKKKKPKTIFGNLAEKFESAKGFVFGEPEPEGTIISLLNFLPNT